MNNANSPVIDGDYLSFVPMGKFDWQTRVGPVVVVL